MRKLLHLIVTACLCSAICVAQHSNKAQKTYLGFDRNTYPGDANLSELHKTFAFTGYWLNNPPGEKANTWRGKRKAVSDAGFGFAVLFNGRTYAQIRRGDAAGLGKSDGAAASRAALREYFPKGTIIFLDQEEGGRLLPEQRAYLHAWLDAVTFAGYRAGVYCSGVPFKEGDGTVVITAEDIRKNAGDRKIAFWVSNDSCAPSPGCTVSTALSPDESGVAFADVWQYAQSPRRNELTSSCARTYSSDGGCYVPGVSQRKRLHVDLNSANSPDPSRGRGGR